MNQGRLFTYAAGGAALALAVTVGISTSGLGLFAADHLDPPARTDPAVDSTPDKAADIADLYVWHTDSSVVIALTFAGPQATTLAASYDRNVLYGIDISNAEPRTTVEFPIRVRFGKDTGANQFGVQVTGVPGVTGAISGPVETNLTKDGVTVRAGLFDDPFFFDSQGLRETRASGTLSFNKDRNFFGGQNITAVIIEIPRNRLANGSNVIDFSSTSARFGGQL